MSISFTQLQQQLQNVARAMDADYRKLQQDLLKTKIIFLQLADNQDAIIKALKAANINVELKTAVSAEEAPVATKE